MSLTHCDKVSELRLALTQSAKFERRCQMRLLSTVLRYLPRAIHIRLDIKLRFSRL